MNEVEEIKSRLDIVEVISGYVQLQKAGRTFKAPCPFHNERTPSFIVSPDRQSWHCFGACGTGGDVIAFVMKREGIEFPEALKMLAERTGVKLPERKASEERNRAHERLYSANEAAARYYRDLLVKRDARKSARDYLERRGVDDFAIDNFLLGYSLPAWEALKEHLTSLGFTDRELLSAGLLVEGDRGAHDRFRGRLMFAIRDPKGRVIGFGARALDDSMPKYINTSQTPLFDKGGTLYALDRAQEGMRRDGTAVVVEGYMDVIAAHQGGFDNVVAQMGTALTERQVRVLKRSAARIVLALDADAAGSEAMVRGHDVVREARDESEGALPVVNWGGLVTYQEAASVDLRVAVLPDGRDPDDVIRADPEAWRRLIEEARPVLDFRLEAAARAHNLAEAHERSQMVHGFLPLLTAVSDPVVRAHYLQRLSRLSMVTEEEITTMLRSSAKSVRSAPQKAPEARRDHKEEFILALLLRYNELRTDALDISETLLWESENRQVLAALQRNLEEDAKTALPPEIQPHFERLISRRLPPFDLKQAREALLDAVGNLQRRQVATEKRATSALLAEREEELGMPLVTQAVSQPVPELESEEARELVELQLRDMETGLRLHGKGNEPGREATVAGD
jgi:DNA primase